MESGLKINRYSAGYASKMMSRPSMIDFGQNGKVAEVGNYVRDNIGDEDNDK